MTHTVPPSLTGATPVSDTTGTHLSQVECLSRVTGGFALAACGRADFGGILAQLADLLGARGAVIARTVLATRSLRKVAQSDGTDLLRWIAAPECLDAMPDGTVQLVAAPDGDGATLMLVLRRGKAEADLLYLCFARTPGTVTQRFLSGLAAAFADAWRHRPAGLIGGLIAERVEPRRKTKARTARARLLDIDNAYGFSRSEFRVCTLLRKGLKTRQIAEELGVSIATVRTHLRGIYAKTGLSGQFEVLHKLGTDAASVHAPHNHSSSPSVDVSQRCAG